MNAARGRVFLFVTAWLALGRLTSPAAEAVLEFYGNNSYVEVGTPESLQIPSGAPLTIECWVYLKTISGGSSGRDMLYSKNNGRSGPT